MSMLAGSNVQRDLTGASVVQMALWWPLELQSATCSPWGELSKGEGEQNALHQHSRPACIESFNVCLMTYSRVILNPSTHLWGLSCPLGDSNSWFYP